MTRFPDWPSRLFAFLGERAEAPFAWGANDCCLFAADAVAAMTGADLADDYRGAYTDARGAARLLAQLGGVEALAVGRLGEEISPLMAQRGDVALLDQDGGATLVVVVGSTVAGPGADGMQQWPLRASTRAWRVG